MQHSGFYHGFSEVFFIDKRANGLSSVCLDLLSPVDSTWSEMVEENVNLVSKIT